MAKVGCSLDEFVQHQENKNTFSKTQRYVLLLQKFLVSRNELREIENIDANNLDVLIANFLLQVRKRDGEQYEPTSAQVFCFKLWSLFKKESLFLNHYGKKEVPKD